MFKGLGFIKFRQFASLFYICILLNVVSPAFSESNLLSNNNHLTNFHYIHDKNNSLNKHSAFKQFKQGIHESLSGNAFNIGNSDDVFWILISVFNDSKELKKRRLVFGSPFVPQLKAYLFHEKGNSITLMKHDANQGFTHRVNNKIKLNSIVFDLPPLQQTEIIIQYQPRGVSFLPISLEHDSVFFNKSHFDSIQAAIFYSFSITVILTFFFFGIAMRSNIVLFYALLFLEYVFFLAIIEGYSFKYFWPDWPQWNMFSGLVMALVFSASGFLMANIVVEKTAIYREFKVFCLGMTILSLLLLLIIPLSGNVTIMTIIHIMMLIMFSCQGYCIYSWMSLSFKRNVLAFYTALFFIGAAFYILILFLDSSALSQWMVVSFNRGMYLFVSLITMGSFAIHLAGLRNDHEKSLQGELDAAKRDAELSRALLESEQKYSQARELASKRQHQLATVSHDIRQPLLSLRSTMDVIVQEQNPTIRNQLHDAFNYIEQLCNNYLSETRPQTSIRGKIEYYPVTMITDSVGKMFQQEALDKGLEFHIMPSSVEISCPPMLIIRILSNFVSNAIKHCDNGKLLIGCRRLPHHLRIDVYDNGPGISPQILETIFDTYEKGDQSEGEGLGLAIVQELANSQKWGISVNSKLGKGSRFSVLVPIN